MLELGTMRFELYSFHLQLLFHMFRCHDWLDRC